MLEWDRQTTTVFRTVFVTIKPDVVYVTVPKTFWSTRTVATTVFSTVSSGVATEVVYVTVTTVIAKRSLADIRAGNRIHSPPPLGDIKSVPSPWELIRRDFKGYGLLQKRAIVTGGTITTTVDGEVAQTVTKSDYHTSTTTVTETSFDIQYLGASTTVTVTSTKTDTSIIVTETIVTEVTEAGETHLTTYTVTRDPLTQPLAVPTPADPNPSPSEPEESEGSQGLSKGAVIGIAAGVGGVSLLIIAVAALCCWKKRQDQSQDKNRQSAMAEHMPDPGIHNIDPSVLGRFSVVAGGAVFREDSSVSGRLEKSRIPSQASSRPGPEPQQLRDSVASTAQTGGHRRTGSAFSGNSQQYGGALGQPPGYQYSTPQELYSEGTGSNPPQSYGYSAPSPPGGYSEMDSHAHSGGYGTHGAVEMQAGVHPMYETHEMPGTNQEYSPTHWVHELPTRR
jgi:hypothetical protein